MGKNVVLWSAVVIELAAIVVLVKATTSDSSPALGLILLAAGTVFLVIGISARNKTSPRD